MVQHEIGDRVAVVDHGKVIALGTPGELISSLGAEHFVEIDVDSFDGRVAIDDMRRLPAVHACDVAGTKAVLTTGSVHSVVPPLLQLLDARGVALHNLALRHATLEDVFVHLTGRHLREDSR